MIKDGVIIKGIGGFYYVDTKDEIIECHAKGKFRKNEITPMVGDRVSVVVNEDLTGSISKIHERKNFLIRPGVANVDAVVIVSALRSPMPDYRLIDKLLVTTESKNIEAILCLNKTDLTGDNNPEVFIDTYRKAGYRVFVTSAKENSGIDELKGAIKEKTVAFAGLSGVGKSSILKLITGKELETGSVSKIERGKHTTRHIELMRTNEGYVFDTPGFSRLEADDIFAENLWELFPEIRKLQGMCKFRTCNHITEPGCSVIEAAKSGQMAQSRYESYVALFDKLKEIKDWERNKQ